MHRSKQYLYSITPSARASSQSASRDAVPWRVSLVLKAPLNENPNYRGHRRTPRDAGRRVPVPRPRRQEEASQRATVGVEYPLIELTSVGERCLAAECHNQTSPSSILNRGMAGQNFITMYCFATELEGLGADEQPSRTSNR